MDCGSQSQLSLLGLLDKRRTIKWAEGKGYLREDSGQEPGGGSQEAAEGIRWRESIMGLG